MKELSWIVVAITLLLCKISFGFLPQSLGLKWTSRSFVSSSTNFKQNIGYEIGDRPLSAERLFRCLRYDSNLKEVVVIPQLAFTPEEQEQIMKSVFDGCDFEVMSRSELEPVLENSRFFSLIPFIFEKNIIVLLRQNPITGRDNMSNLKKFYKYILKHRDVLDELEKQNRLGMRQDLDHIIVFHFNENHASDHMVRMPMRHSRIPLRKE
jgi:hypothetical protein